MEEQLESLENVSSPNTKSSSLFLNFSDPNNPYRVESGDNTTVTLVTNLFTSENYVTWSRTMRQALKPKNKLGFINGSIIKPKSSTNPLFDAWERCNDMIVSWI